MGQLTFSDGIKFDTEGPLRAIHKEDGWYVVGKGMLVPVRDAEEAEELIELINKVHRIICGN